MTNYKEIYIVAPGGVVTGGPELAHQLGAELGGNGSRVAMVYYPFDQTFECPVPYKKYAVPVSSQIPDRPDVLIVLPEVYTGLFSELKQAVRAIWWLSVDNYQYQGRRLDWMRLKRFVFEFKELLVGRRAGMATVKKVPLHFYQSIYARDFLKSHGIEALRLSDYLRSDHGLTPWHPSKKKQIAFNPKKGFETTKKLIQFNPDFNFVPIQNLDATGVKNLLAESEIYIDFGHHPGKDRMPREAAMAGCFVITGRRGSAANAEDVPVPEFYKIDESSKDFLNVFRDRTVKIFEGSRSWEEDFQHYVNFIRSEEEQFRKDVKQIFVTGS